MHLIIAGRGSLAKAVANICKEVTSVTCAFFDPSAEKINQSVAIHCSGSGSVLPQLLAYCEERAIPLIQASTGHTLPSEVKTTVVDAPNLALPIVYLMGFVADAQTCFELMGQPHSSVIESHQSTKKSVPGTARRFASAVKIGESEIVSVR